MFETVPARRRGCFTKDDVNLEIKFWLPSFQVLPKRARVGSTGYLLCTVPALCYTFCTFLLVTPDSTLYEDATDGVPGRRSGQRMAKSYNRDTSKAGLISTSLFRPAFIPRCTVASQPVPGCCTHTDFTLSGCVCVCVWGGGGGGGGRGVVFASSTWPHQW